MFEIKTFGRNSEVADLQQALSQYFEEGIATELTKAGVAKAQIVLGFWFERLRQDTEFAIA